MEHFYNNIDSENWFDFQEIYKNMVTKYPDGSHFVEVGVWKGMSACFMAVEIINSNKNIKFDLVDTWDFVETSTDNISKSQFDTLYDIFEKNITPIRHTVNIVKSISWDASKYYDDNSIDFIFIDASHDYDSVTKDLKSWFPKLKVNGTIAGHDYYYQDVFNAVNDFFGEKNIKVSVSSWVYTNE
jgi:predicted O-methyltransferase YrrM